MNIWVQKSPRKRKKKRVPVKKERVRVDKFKTIHEVLAMESQEMFNTIFSDNRSEKVQRVFLKRAMKEVFNRVKNEFTKGVAITLKLNVEYLLKKHKITKQNMADFIKECTYDGKFKDVLSLFENFENSFDKPVETAVLIGFSFNIDHDILLHHNLEYLDKKNLVGGFRYYNTDFEVIERSRKILLD